MFIVNVKLKKLDKLNLKFKLMFIIILFNFKSYFYILPLTLNDLCKSFKSILKIILVF